MYRPTIFQEDDVDKMVYFMKANSFATLVSISEGVPAASHIPLVVTVEGDVVKLIGHLAKQNPQWQSLSNRYRAGMMNDIVGFEMPLTRLEDTNSVKTKVQPIDRTLPKCCYKVPIRSQSWHGNARQYCEFD